jgi:putative oxidoreductase
MLLLGGKSVLGAYPTVGIILLIIFLLGASFQIHNYWKEKNAQARQADKINFMKNMALVWALLMILILPQPWPLSLELG